MRLSLFAFGFSLLALISNAYGAAMTQIVPAPAGATEGVTFNSETGNYVVTYEAEDEIRPKGLYQTILVPATKIDPTVKSRFTWGNLDGRITYKFKVKNGKSSEQNLESLILIATSADGGPVSPKGWDGSAVDNFGASGLRIGWSYSGNESLGGLAPGKSLGGFELASSALPGVGTIELRGAAPIQAYAGYGPSQHISDEVSKLDKRDFLSAFVAVPKIAVAGPYDGAAVLDALRTHITKDIVDLKLIEPTLATQLDRSLQAAADAVRRNTPKAAREHLHDAMKLLKKDHPDCDKDDADDKDDDDDKNRKGKTGSIDRLAARVVAFDIKYVEKRLK